jgi:hypothetical protein
MFGVEECLTSVAFMLPKIHEVRKNSKENETTLKSISELALALINQAHKLQSITDRFYVLLIALRKLIQCSLNQILDGNQSSIFDIYNLQWFVALWNDTPVEQIQSQFKEELCMTLIEACL